MFKAKQAWQKEAFKRIDAASARMKKQVMEHHGKEYTRVHGEIDVVLSKTLENNCDPAYKEIYPYINYTTKLYEPL